MKYRPAQAVHTLLLFLITLVTACQSVGPTALVQPTAVALTPETESESATATLAHTAEPTIEHSPTPTIASYLSAVPGQFNGLRLDFWHPWSGETANRVAGLVEEFNRSNVWGIRVEVQSYYSAGALYDAVRAALDQIPSEMPQIIAAPEEHLTVWAEEGALLPLDEYIHLPELGFSGEAIDSYYPEFWRQNQTANQQIAVPLLRSANVMFYNRTWAEELGFQQPPQTTEEFKEQACAAAVANNTSRILEKFGTGGWLVDTGSLTVLSWLDAFGAHPFSGGKNDYSFESKEGQKAFFFLRGMLDDGCAWIKRSQTPDDFFSRRLALFYTGGLQDILIQKQLFELSGSQDKWTVLPYPRQDGSAIIYSNGYSLAVGSPAQSRDNEERQSEMAAWLFIRWLSDPQRQMQLAKTFPSLPVNSVEASLLEKSGAEFPWNFILPLVKVSQPAPAAPSWRAVRRLVEDAGWQVFHLPVDQVPTILPLLDEGVKEMLEQ